LDFVGAKAALFCDGQILTYLRDTHPGLPWPGSWDLPGGGREADETAEDCLLRELHEEFGLRLSPQRLIWRSVLPSITCTSRDSVFFGGWLSVEEVATVRFGDEGQEWRLMDVADFLAHPAAVPELQRRAGLVWADLGRGPQGTSATG
jgi:8-oxo-dGTP diphosphatase